VILLRCRRRPPHGLRFLRSDALSVSARTAAAGESRAVAASATKDHQLRRKAGRRNVYPQLERGHPPTSASLPTAIPIFAPKIRYAGREPLSPQDAALLKDHSEAARLVVGKRLGWSAVPSNTFVVHPGHDEIVLAGVGQGHGVGLCQRGASAMAQQGTDFREIIRHYFPNTTISQFTPRLQRGGR
jgi:SpoIID/LytB domain protein